MLAGPEDFTGRLAYYVDLVRLRTPLRYSNAAAASSFIDAHGASSFLLWAGFQEFRGAVNAACDGGMSAFDLYHRAGMVLDEAVNAVPAPGAAQPGELSPFDFPAQVVMDTGRAASLGYRFDHIDEWLDDTIRQHDLAFV